MSRAGFALLFVALLAAPAFAQVNVTGDWDVTIESPQGTNTVKMTLTQDGEKVSGLFKSPMGELPFDGTLTGADLKCTFALPVQGQSLEIVMTGKVAGEAIAGKVQFGGFGEGDWTAKRAPAATAAAPAAPAAAPPATTTAPATTAEAAPVAGGVSGEWDLTFKTPNGDLAATAKVTEDAGKLNGTLTSQMGEAPFTGTLEGKSLKVTFNFETPNGTLPVTMTGDIEGTVIPNGKADITGMGTLEWTAKKKQ
jgi:hypothetical protein